jgi:hypothetical protein
MLNIEYRVYFAYIGRITKIFLIKVYDYRFRSIIHDKPKGTFLYIVHKFNQFRLDY